MAAAFCVERVSLHGVGAFGRRVVELLATRLPNCQVAASGDMGDLEEAFRQRPHAVVVALWRPEPDLCERADELAHAVGIPWLPITMEHPVIEVGPWILPAQGPCFRCYRARRVQHDRQYQATKVRDAAYHRDAACGPVGFLPYHARLAAGIGLRVLSQQSCRPGRVVTLPLLGKSVESAMVVACHGCPRCGEPVEERDLRRLLQFEEVANVGQH